MDRPAASNRIGRNLYAWPSFAAGVVALVAIGWLATRSGGFYAPDYASAGAVVFAALAVLLLVHLPRHRFSAHALIGLGALAGLAAWTGLSARWSLDPGEALHAMQRAALYTGLFALGLLAVGSGRYARWVLWAALVVVLVIVGAGLLSRLAPDLVASTPPDRTAYGYRLSHPFGYWNTFGGLAALGAVLALGLAADPRTVVPLRALATGAAVLLAVSMYLSLSRGAWLAMIVGLVVLVAMGAHRGSLLWALGIVGGASFLAIARLRGYPALVDDPAAGSGREAQGHAFLAQLVVITGAAIAAMAVVAAGRASQNLMRATGQVLRPIAIGLAIVLALTAVGTYVVKAGPIEGVAAGALDDSSSWVSRQWRDFLRPATFSESGTARLTTSKGTRSDLYRVAFDGFESHPLRGDGAGSFKVRWMRDRDVSESVINAHSLELETLGELGAVGGLLLLAFLASLVAAAVRARIRPGGLGRSQAAAAAAACSVWVFHSFVDWDWQMPAFTGLALVLAATLYPLGRGVRRRRDPSAARESGACPEVRPQGDGPTDYSLSPTRKPLVSRVAGR